MYMSHRYCSSPTTTCAISVFVRHMWFEVQILIVCLCLIRLYRKEGWGRKQGVGDFGFLTSKNLYGNLFIEMRQDNKLSQPVIMFLLSHFSIEYWEVVWREWGYTDFWYNFLCGAWFLFYTIKKCIHDMDF